MTDTNTTDKATIQPMPDDRPAYAPPRATRLGDAHPGAGADCFPGSSATEICNAGNSAGGGCGGYGNNAGAECVGDGSGPGTDCWLSGIGY